jgi:branched-chain amino acid transport system ATP-binding protein
MLKVEGIQVAYDGIPALQGVSFQVRAGTITAIIGSNGAGKSTILKAISGLQRLSAGAIYLDAARLDQRPAYQVAALGIALVPEGRRIFSRLTVRENLIVGAYTNKSPSERARALERIYDLFPILKERPHQKAGTLSGGEQQMLAIARALMLKPRLLMLDEPSLGLAPVVVDRIFETIQRINQEGTTILLVEQNVREALELATQAYVLQTGRIVLEGPGQALLQNDLVRQAYLGI